MHASSGTFIGNCESVISNMEKAADRVTAIAPLMRGPYGIAAYGAAEMLNIHSAKAASIMSTANAQSSVNRAQTDFGNPELLAQVIRREEERRSIGFYGGMGFWNFLKTQYGFRGGINEDFQKGVSDTTGALMNARRNQYLYGSEASKAIVNYSSKNKIPLGSISDYTRNKIIDEATLSRHEKWRQEEDFQREVESRMPVLQDPTINRAVIRGRITRELLADIDNQNDNIPLKYRFDEKRRIADQAIQRYLQNNEFDIAKEREIHRNIDLRVKAERHRHLAEF